MTNATDSTLLYDKHEKQFSMQVEDQSRWDSTEVGRPLLQIL